MQIFSTHADILNRPGIFLFPAGLSRKEGQGLERNSILTEGRASKKSRVLHIEDDAMFQSLFKAAYSQEFDILSLSSGDDVPAVLEKEAVDVIVLDYVLPGKNGIEVLTEVRKAYPAKPVIFYTGQGSEEVAREAFSSGATDYFVKEAFGYLQREKMLHSVQKAMEKSRIEAELEQQRFTLEHIIDHNPYAMMVTDSQGHPERVNRALIKLFGMAPTPDVVVFDEDFPLPGDLREAIQADWQEKLHTYSIFNDPLVMCNESARKSMARMEKGEITKFDPLWYAPPVPIGKELLRTGYITATGFSVKDQEGRIKKYVLMYEDITARFKAEEALKKSHRDLQEAHGELEQKVEERTAELSDAYTKLKAHTSTLSKLHRDIAARNRELEDFSYRVGHDMNNQLLVIRRLLELPKLAEDHREYMIAHVNTLMGFVDHILDLARAGRVIADREPIDGASLVEDAFRKAKLPRVKSECMVTRPFPTLYGDHRSLSQVFTSLMDNTFEHRVLKRKKVLITVSARVSENCVEIIYRDNGPGIPPALTEKIFDFSFTTKVGERPGVGLAIVQRILIAHDGAITAHDNSSGGGAEFIITLPAGPEALHSCRPPQ